ncbi:PepSY-associated TM helix domain-containing protein [Novosphingobium tardum]|uniref:PepSY-associated TM helix domain-containing protein n=1 Tax=Novosphingobium tardum TaxID=1538021 RepID=A0ABV8RU67_9SPHN
MHEFWITLHRWSGLFMVLFLTIAGVTGCILVFRGPIDRELNPGLYRLHAASGPTTPDVAVAAVHAYQAGHRDEQVVQFPLNVPANRALPVKVAARPGAPAPATDEVFLDPADGSVIGRRASGPGWDRAHFIAGVSDLHFTLLAGTWGRWLLGVVALVWLISNFIGAWLTWPQRPPYWKQWKRNWQFRRSSAMPRLLLDLHRASGLWLLPALIVLAFTSAALNFFSEAWEPAVTAISPLERNLFDHEAPFPEGTSPTLRFADGLAAAKAQAARDGLAWQPAAMLYLPEWNFYGVKFTPDGILDYRDLGPVDYYFDAHSRRFAHEVNPYDDSTGLAAIRILYPLHSGEIFGGATVAVIFLAGLTTVGQGVTGVYVWWKKRKSRVARLRAARAKDRNGLPTP